MRGLFWLGVGLAAGAYATRRATIAAQRLTPSGLAAEMADAVRELGAGLGAFGAEVRAGMDTRQQELAELVERRTGAVVPTLGQAASGEPITVYEQAATGRATRRGVGPAGAGRASTGRAITDARARRAGA